MSGVDCFAPLICMERDFLVLAGHKFWWVWFWYFLSTVITLFAHRQTSRLHTCINITLLLDNPLIVLFKSLRDPSVCFIDSNIHCTLCKGTRKAISVILETPQPWFPHEVLSGEEIVRREMICQGVITSAPHLPPYQLLYQGRRGESNISSGISHFSK